MISSTIDDLSPYHRQRLAAALEGDLASQLWLAPWRSMDCPDPWQKDALIQLVTRGDNVLMLCSRGAGKTEVFSRAAYLEAGVGGFALILSRSDRQALRIMARVASVHRELRVAGTAKLTMHELELTNGGRVLALPCSGDTIVGEHGVTLLGIDEAARISDAFYAVVTPMLIVSERVTGITPRLALLSTPYGKRGFFWEEWEGRRDGSWKRHKYPWTDCPRISAVDVERERRRHGELWVRQEYECEFLDTAGSFFDVSAFESLEDPEMDVNW